MPRVSPDFNKDVFINCPFDDKYASLFHAMIFTVHDVGFRPRCALEESNAGTVRFTKILEIISECKYGIHDLSRTELDIGSRLPRFNMPLELGVDLGCKAFGNLHQKEKVLLILDVKPYRYQKFVSDISGQDIKAHGRNVKQLIEIVRNWLRLEIDPRKYNVPGGGKIFQRYRRFQVALPALCEKLDWNRVGLPFVDFSFAAATWIKENPI